MLLMLPLPYRTLYKQGGIRRFYAGLPAALLHAPAARFGDTAANDGVMYLLNEVNPLMETCMIIHESCRDRPVDYERRCLPIRAV